MGCGEIIKYGFLDVPGLLTQLEHKPLIKHRDSVSTVIARYGRPPAEIGAAAGDRAMRKEHPE